MSRKNTSIMWEYFKKVDISHKIASCLTCGKQLSYRSTTHNLRTHIRLLHPQLYAELLLKETGGADVQVKKEDENSNDSTHQSADILSYFEQETGGRVRCIVCRASRPNNADDLKNHLREKHPKLIGAIGQDVPGSDASGNEEGATYTEVIYLEEDAKKTPKYVFKSKRSRSIEHKKTKKERRLSSSSDESPIKKRKHETFSELDTFLTYIRCLLMQVPNDVCAKLQMDIINLIVNAKLNKNHSHEALETSMVMKDTLDRAGVITVAEIPVSNMNVIEPVEHCFDGAGDKIDN